MLDASNLKLTIHFNHPALEPEQRDQQVSQLFAALQEMSMVEAVDRDLDSDRLIVEVDTGNARRVLGFLADQLGDQDQSIALEAEANGKKLTLKAHTEQELQIAIKAVRDFVSD